jgi:hypothetical protein
VADTGIARQAAEGAADSYVCGYARKHLSWSPFNMGTLPDDSSLNGPHGERRNEAGEYEQHQTERLGEKSIA